jgi:hypothetical protein
MATDARPTRIDDDARARWKSVGRRLIERRQELGYKQRSSWAKAVSSPGFGPRVIEAMEIGTRANYADRAIQAAESAYLIAPGALRDALEYGADRLEWQDVPEAGPHALVATDRPAPEVERRRYDVGGDEITQTVYTDVESDDDLSPEERKRVIEAALAHARAQALIYLHMERERRRRMREQDGEEGYPETGKS